MMSATILPFLIVVLEQHETDSIFAVIVTPSSSDRKQNLTQGFLNVKSDSRKGYLYNILHTTLDVYYAFHHLIMELR